MTWATAWKVVRWVRALDTDLTRAALRGAVRTIRERSAADPSSRRDALLERMGLERRPPPGHPYVGVVAGFGLGVVLGAACVAIVSPVARHELVCLVQDLTPWVEGWGEGIRAQAPT